MTRRSEVRVGIVGCGNIGHYHAERYQEAGATVVGGVDISESARETFAAEFDVAAYEDPEPLYESVDAVSVTTPNKFHAEYAITALETGLDVIVEKPLAHTLEDAERIAVAAADAEGFCMVGFHTRFENEVEVLRSYRGDGRLGETFHVEANYLRRRGIPGRGSWFTSREVAGGGALIDIGAHALDLSLYLLGFPEVEEVNAVTRSLFGGREEYAYIDMWGEDQGPGRFDVEDSVTAFVRCAGDRTVTLEVGWAANRPSKQEYVLHGDEGGATYDRGSGDLTIHDTATTGAVHMLDSAVETRDNDPHRDEIDYFLTHVAAGESPDRNTVEQGLVVQRVLEAVYEASASGSAVSL
jgi:predicted dehydrogenase